MFNVSKYTTWYNSIINKATQRLQDSNIYYEKHHIIPKALGGTNNKNNLVKLTAKEHFICHWLLTKMVNEKLHIQKMKAALGYFLNNTYRNLPGYVIAIARQNKSESQKGQPSCFKGRHHTEENKLKHSLRMTGHKYNTEESKQRKREKWLINNPNDDPVVKAKQIKRLSKSYIITNPHGEIFVITNLKEFCKENKLHNGNMVSVSKDKLNHYKDWKCEPVEKDK